AGRPGGGGVMASDVPGGTSLSPEQFAASAGVTVAQLARLVALGVVEEPDDLTAAGAVRLRRMRRLCRDLGVNLTGAAIIVDLVERLDRLDFELTRLRGGD